MSAEKNEQNPLLALKAGDVVVVDSSRYGDERLSIRRIHRITATQIIIRTECADMEPMDRRYHRANGRLVGADSYSGEWVRAPAPDLLDRAEKQTLVARLSWMQWKDLHLDTLRAVSAAIKSSTISP